MGSTDFLIMGRLTTRALATAGFKHLVAGEHGHFGLEVSRALGSHLLLLKGEKLGLYRLDVQQARCLVGRLDEPVDRENYRGRHHQPKHEDSPPVAGQSPQNHPGIDLEPRRACLIERKCRRQIPKDGINSQETGAGKFVLDPINGVHRACLPKREYSRNQEKTD